MENPRGVLENLGQFARRQIVLVCTSEVITETLIAANDIHANTVTDVAIPLTGTIE
jgi:hypothetical protein